MSQAAGLHVARSMLYRLFCMLMLHATCSVVCCMSYGASSVIAVVLASVATLLIVGGHQLIELHDVRPPPSLPHVPCVATLTTGDPDQSSLADATLALVQAHRLRSCDPPLASTFFPSLPSPIPHPPFLRALLLDFPFV